MLRLEKLNLRRVVLPLPSPSKVATMRANMSADSATPGDKGLSDDDIYCFLAGVPPERWAKIPSRYNDKISRIIWKSFKGALPLAHNADFLDWFVCERVSGSESLARRLIEGFTWYWPDNANDIISRLSKYTSSNVAWPSETWRQQAIQKAGSGADIAEMVAEQWGGVPSTGRGLVRQLWLDLVRATGNRLSAGHDAMGYAQAIVKISFDEQGKFRWLNHEVYYLDTVLPPLLARIASPVSAYFKEHTLRAFCRLGGGVWEKSCPDAQKVGIQWLATLRVERFFDYVEKYQAKQGKADNLRHLKDRRAFWESAFEAGIDEVQLVLGDNLYKLLSESDRALIKPANLSTKGTSFTPDHAALIVKIREMTMVEWSHTRASCAWKQRHSKAPICNKIMYKADDLVKDPDKKIPHRGDWQSKYANLIYQETRVLLSRG